VPIPLGPARERVRGYNQSAKLATALALRTGLRVDLGLLARIRETRSQTTLTPDQRSANLRGAFARRGRLPERIVLVDDVFTTGATLASAAKTLLDGGAESVSAVSFARAELPLAAISRTV
jgi:ComF family protein